LAPDPAGHKVTKQSYNIFLRRARSCWFHDAPHPCAGRVKSRQNYFYTGLIAWITGGLDIEPEDVFQYAGE
jgi:hypothetical protein